MYLTYTDAPSVGSPDTQVKLIESSNFGQTWSKPVLVNPDAGSSSEFFPSIAVDQSSGNLAVSWYDTRNDPNNVKTQIFGAVSNNGGASFLPDVLLSDGTSNAANPLLSGIARNVQYGEYTGATFAGGVFYPIWADNSTELVGNPNPPEFDLATERVVVEQVADAELSAVGNPKLVATAGEPLSDAVVATFIDENPAPAMSDFTASIAWGDGTISEGTITPDGTGGFNVTGTHTYASQGIYNTLLAIVDAGGSSASADGVVAVSPGGVAIPNAPKLIAQDDTGITHTDGITKNNGSASAPLSFTVSGVSPPTSFVQLYQVTWAARSHLGLRCRRRAARPRSLWQGGRICH